MHPMMKIAWEQQDEIFFRRLFNQVFMGSRHTRFLAEVSKSLQVGQELSHFVNNSQSDVTIQLGCFNCICFVQVNTRTEKNISTYK